MDDDPLSLDHDFVEAEKEVPLGYHEGLKYMPKHHVEWMLDNMKSESFKLQRKINHTPRWRVIKRYFLLEKLYKLDESRGLIAHVMNDDEGY